MPFFMKASLCRSPEFVSSVYSSVKKVRARRERRQIAFRIFALCKCRVEPVILVPVI